MVYVGVMPRMSMAQPRRYSIAGSDGATWGCLLAPWKDWLREVFIDRGIMPYIPGRKSRNKRIRYDKRRDKRRNKIEIMFGRLKDWRRVSTHYDSSPTVFLSAIVLAATVLLWL